MTKKEFASKIDHTNLKPDSNLDTIKTICYEALEYEFASVCVLPHYVNPAYDILRNSNVNVCTVIGFPLGATFTETKIHEAEEALHAGAKELDMVMNIAGFKSEEFDIVREDIEALSDLVDINKAILKVIIETCLLRDEEKITACELVSKAGADYIKTSTGFSKEGAIIEDIKLMRQYCSKEVKVKASGGIKDLNKALNMINAGADRIGTSSSVKIMSEFES